MLHTTRATLTGADEATGSCHERAGSQVESPVTGGRFSRGGLSRGAAAAVTELSEFRPEGRIHRNTSHLRRRPIERGPEMVVLDPDGAATVTSSPRQTCPSDNSAGTWPEEAVSCAQ